MSKKTKDEEQETLIGTAHAAEPVSADDWEYDESDFEHQGELATPYFTRDGYWLKADLDEFELYKVGEDKPVRTFKELNAVVCYFHTVAKLEKGRWTGSAVNKKRKEWTQDEKEVLAHCYESPSRTQFPAMFAAFPEALKVKGMINYRTFIWLYLLEEKIYAPLTVGPSVLRSLKPWADVAKNKKRPRWATVTRITLVKDKVPGGDEAFFRPTLTATDIASAPTLDEAKALFKDYAWKCNAEHEEVLKRMHRESIYKMQNGFAPVASIAHRETIQIEAPIGKAHAPERDPFEDETPPF